MPHTRRHNRSRQFGFTLIELLVVLLILGWRAVKQGKVEAHKKIMVSAFLVSTAFLICYLTHKYTAGDTKFTHEGAIRIVYFVILATHVPLAAIMGVPILLLLRWGLRGEIDRHRRLARWTLPVWLYVSITGVVIYVMLYHVDPVP